MKVLIGCEESQEVCKAFRELGHEAYSCDIQDCSGGHPEWHIKGDLLEVINDNWDLGIFHPPCTYLTVAGNKWFKPEYADRFPNRQKQREEAIEFFMAIAVAPIERIAIENPIGVMSSVYRKPDQIIQPYQFGHPNRKATCLWLKNLPVLEHTEIVTPNIHVCKSGKTMDKEYMYLVNNKDRAKLRSKTYTGIAKAMAKQWGDLLQANLSKDAI